MIGKRDGIVTEPARWNQDTMEHQTPKPLNYLGVAPDQRSDLNIPAALSISCALAAAVFVLTMCVGVWQHFLPALARNAGWISGALAVIAIINGALGALQAPRDSKWYEAALAGYGIGLFVACLTPVFFMLG